MELEPQNALYVSNCAIALMSGDNAREALGMFEKALPMLRQENSPNYATVLANYALALGKCGYSDNAVRCLREAEQMGYPNVAIIRTELEKLGIYYH